jgi:colanic acid biosynthesis protein WcaH
LLTWREDRYYPPGWHVPGGIIRFRETFGDRIQTVARTELGAEIGRAEGPIAVNQIIHPIRDVRGHFISLLFRCTLESDPNLGNRWREESSPEAGQWAWHHTCPQNLISVHEIYRSFM